MGDENPREPSNKVVPSHATGDFPTARRSCGGGAGGGEGEQQLGTHKKFIFSEHFRSKSFVSLNQAKCLNFYGGGSSVTHCVKCHKVLDAEKKFSTQEVFPDEEQRDGVINIH